MSERQYDYLYVLTKFNMGYTARELAEEFGCEQRTIFRWLMLARRLVNADV